MQFFREIILKELIKKLKRGCVYHEKRWSGDTHSDMGGTINESETDNLMQQAAEHLERFQKIIDALEFINSKL